MRLLPSLVFACFSCICSQHVYAQADVQPWIDDEMEALMDVYVHLHQHPEVSFQETETAKYVAEQWAQAGFEVTKGVGGTGVVALLENGQGPTLMLRTDLDALPVTEATGLAIASKQTVVTDAGTTSGVMHACGHDIHMTNLIGVARYLGSHLEQFQGTVLLIGQPAEERGAGAKAMLEDGLFTRFPKPDFAMALHCESRTPTGKVALSPGYNLANVDSVDITMRGRGGHGSAPHTTIDPIMQAAELVVALQTIVSREINPRDPAVVTVGAIHGGTKHNIIGDTCHLQLTVRSYSDEVRQHLLEAIRRKAFAVAEGARAPEPTVEASEGTPSLKNDEELTSRMTHCFQGAIGEENVLPMEPVMGGEDFSRYGLEGVPILMYRLGVVTQSRLDRFQELGVPPPSLHSPTFYPDASEAIPVGLKTMISGTLELLKKP